MAVSPARRLIVPRRDASPRGFTPASIVLRWPDHNRAAALDYSIDVTNDLATGDSASMVVGAVTPSLPGGLTTSNESVTGNVATVWLSGGVADKDYVVTLTVTSVDDRALVYPISILVVE